MISLTLGELCRVLQGELLQGDPNIKVQGVSTDSRQIKSGEVFFALKGERFDGHDFVREALAKGAIAAIVARKIEGMPQGGLIIVPDTLKALQDLALYHRRTAFKGELIGITGSSGKTTTKNLVARVLEAKFKVLKTPGNFNNEIGLPLTLLNLKPEHQVVVVEMGMRGRGEIASLCQVAQPTVGVITNIGTAHLGRLGSVENIALAKRELLESLPPGGWAVLNGDDPWCRRLAEGLPVRPVFYGFEDSATFQARDIRMKGLEGIEFVVRFPEGETKVRLPVPGKHNVLNSLAALTLGYFLGVEIDSMVEKLLEWPAESMRQEILPGPQGSLIYNDAYNANPESTLAALDVLKELPGRRIAVLGDMLELGEKGPELHQKVGRRAAEVGLSMLVTVGELAREIATGALDSGMSNTRVFSFLHPREAGQFLARHLQPGDVVLLKGSRAARLEQVLEELQEVKR
ncbi:UDP-N-acetylmuramoyl-tripeptide--D-alanyl-D-alanine ligase [Thermanaeromonas toyohensis ToBE]|uniref:UDP-N-acetylmuramoyl-tripeptide--D-alanyl-D-alanine ligase n=1 Tax=Thermanaeromonas toyohensis ToBE TaxID=698762 RepID=A0A1W1VLW9_9FIRM|nr:UDP-N-acetylmuramoyl-tripeptide--D-alanyl-D-alanine ligase [Thermanaeromonas toyohensis]SMB94316.1 UDP-N-acetylmuramoyl-tripeptide--D-alanyl-D-alanine ligase [Thermanaeromonas toyohensis ToBE]